MTMAPSYGLYGYNPNYTLAESPYSRLTGQYTPISEQMVPGAASYLQPVFVNIDPMIGNRGIPSYPSLISEFAMSNPQLPLATSGQYYQPQQGYYPQQGRQQAYYPQQGQQYPMQGGMQRGRTLNIYNNYYGRPAPTQQTQQEKKRSEAMQQMSGFGQWLGGVFSSFAQNMQNVFS